MTRHLEAAFREATQLSDEQQDALAAIIMQEIAADRRWDELFDRPESHDLLAKLADQALADHRAGRTTRLDTAEL